MTDYPERDYRWARARAFMEENELDGLLLLGSDRSERLDGAQYLGRDRRYQHMVFPREGTPTLIAFAAQAATQNMVSREMGRETWVEDIRTGPVSHELPKVVEEKGLSGSRLGVVGLGWAGPFLPHGWIPSGMWERISSSLPNATFVDVTTKFGFLMMVRSEADIALLGKAARAGDNAIRAMMAMAKPGVSELDLYAEGYSSQLREGMRVTWMLFQTGIENPTWGEPTWLARPEAPRILQETDQVGGELFPMCAEMHTHVNFSFVLGQPPELTTRLAALAREAYEIGLGKLKPGASFHEIAQAMAKPIEREGAWHLTPEIANINPIIAGGTSGNGIRQHVPELVAMHPKVDAGEGVPFDFEIEKGMTFSLQPDARIGRHWAIVGGVTAVTDGGAIELNEVSPRQQYI